MTDRKKIFSKEESCLTMKEMMDYVHDRLSMKERNRVERHTLDCELCNEALEGYTFAKDGMRAEVIVGAINNEITKKDEEAFVWRRLAAVVALIVFLGGGFYYLNNNLNQEVSTVAVAKEEVSEQVQESNQALTTDSVIAIAPQLNGNAIEVKPNSDGATWSNNEKDVVIGYSSTMDAKQDAEVVEEEAMPAAVSEPTMAASPMKGEVKVELKLADEAVMVKEEDKKVALYSNKSNSLSSSKEKVKKVEARSANLSEVHADTISISAAGSKASLEFDQGLKLYTKGEYHKATKYFEEISKMDLNYEEARWYLAKSYLVIGEKEKAKTIFKEIVEMNGVFKERAEGELKTLE